MLLLMNPLLTSKAFRTCLLIVTTFSALVAHAQTPEEQAIPRLVQLSQIPTSASVDEILDLAAENSSNRMRQQFLMTALIQIGPSVKGDAYVKSVLDNDGSPVRLTQGALAYFAARPDSWMEPYAIQYLASRFDGETRSMAANLAGQLGMSDQVDAIKAVIDNKDYGDVRSQAAFGLAYLMPVAEFEEYVNSTDLGDWDKKLATELNAFVFADQPTKRDDVANKLRRSEIIFPMEAMRFLLKTENRDLLTYYVVRADQNGVSIPNRGNQVLLRILGYEISGNVDEIVVSPLAPL